MHGLRTGLHALLAVATVMALTAAALVAWRPSAPQPPSLDLRPIPAPLRTSQRSRPPREIRVCVTAGPVTSARIKTGRGAVWRSIETGRKLPIAFFASDVLVRGDGNGFRIADQKFDSRQIEIVPESSPGIWIDEHLYRGRVRLTALANSRLVAVNIVPLEEYVASVVDSEMPAVFPADARRAQAVVARTYAVARQAATEKGADFDVYASERSQKYLGVEYRDATGRRLAGESASSRQSALDTQAVVLTENNRVFTSYYSAVCGGCTTIGTELFPDAASCHQSVVCNDCREGERYRWSTQMSVGDFRDVINALDRGKLGTIRRVRMLTSPGKGQLAQFEVRDDRRAIELSGWDLRQGMAGRLFSPHVTVRLVGDQVIIDGRGHGHGVGFCQWGARGQALNGRTWQQILRRYYPGAELASLDHL